MKNLDLNAYGVSEMSVNEMKDTDGGVCLFLLGLLLGCIVGLIAVAGATSE